MQHLLKIKDKIAQNFERNHPSVTIKCLIGEVRLASESQRSLLEKLFYAANPTQQAALYAYLEDYTDSESPHLTPDQIEEGTKNLSRDVFETVSRWQKQIFGPRKA